MEGEPDRRTGAVLNTVGLLNVGWASSVPAFLQFP